MWYTHVFLVLAFVFQISLAEILTSHDNEIQSVPRAASDVHPDINLTTPEMINRRGYPNETHTVISGGGYILNIHRIANANRPPVYINHGFLGSSADYVMLGPEKALAYILYDAGFDVWIGNIRGNFYSKKHETLTSSNYKYWQFCMHETASIDLPKIIDYILDKTSKNKIDYIGFSMGSMELFIMMDQKPEYNSKINQMHALAPVAYLGTKETTFNVMKSYLRISTFTMKLLGIGEFAPTRELSAGLIEDCSDPDNVGLCANIYTLIFTSGSKQIDKTLLPVVLSHSPAGTSTKLAEHLGDLMDSDKFRQYNYGAIKNMRVYGSSSPPDYLLNKTTVPVYIYHATKDIFAEPHNVDRLCTELTNCKEKNHVNDTDFIHGDFLIGSNAKALVYDRLVNTLKL